MNEQHQILSNLLQCNRVSRAIQQTFQQNTLDKNLRLYSLLQQRQKQYRQKIKNSTGELRKTLYNKYDDLLGCSHVLDNIKDFVKRISSIEASISNIMSTGEQEKEQNNHPYSRIQEIEGKLECCEFPEAMQLCDTRKMHINDDQLYYLDFLKVEIIYKMEQQLTNLKLNPQLIMQVIKTLQQFMQMTAPQSIQSIVKANQHKKKDEQSLLGIIWNKLVENRQLQYPFTHNSLIEVIFHFKILSLRRIQLQIATKIRGPMQQSLGLKEQIAKITAFFSDLNELLDNKQQNEHFQAIKNIFMQNTDRINESLTQIFIRSGQGNLILFEQQFIIYYSQLYEGLLNCEQFLKHLHRLHILIYGENYPTPYFYKLWSDYYKQLIAYLLEETRPTRLIEVMMCKYTNIPQQFRKYVVSDEGIQQSENILLSMNKKTFIMVDNLHILMNKKKQQENIMAQFKKCVQEVQQKLTQIEQNKNKFNLRKHVLLILLYVQLQQAIIQIIKPQKYQMIKLEQFVINTVPKYVDVFDDRSCDLWLLDLDLFFATYNVSKLISSQKEALKKIILTLIKAKMDTYLESNNYNDLQV